MKEEDFSYLQDKRNDISIRMAFCECKQSKSFPLCDGTQCEKNPSIGPLIIEITDKTVLSNRKKRRSQQPETQQPETQELQENLNKIEEKKVSFGKNLNQEKKIELPNKVDKRKIKNIFTQEQVKQHCTENDCWMIINGNVYDITAYFPYHPGGKRALLKFGGRDGTENVEFHSSRMIYLLDNYFYIGRLDSAPEESRCVIS